MAASALMLNHTSQPGAFSTSQAMAGSATTGSGSSTDNGTSISSNDFLTLLVTEMKNQDPTSAQDPNQYINQLVGVNSLEQLIQMNQTLSVRLPPPSGKAEPVVATQTSGSLPGDLPSVQPQPVQGAYPPVTRGNLSIPESSPAAHRIASALGHASSRL